MIHTSYTVGITTGQFKALESVMVDQKEWITNAILARAEAFASLPPGARAGR